MNQIKREVILDALQKHDHNRTHTAEYLGISIRTLRNAIVEYDFPRVPGTKRKQEAPVNVENVDLSAYSIPTLVEHESLSEYLYRVELALVQQACAKSFSRAEAARRLGLNRTTLVEKLRRMPEMQFGVEIGNA